jgi:hypothetical protein
MAAVNLMSLPFTVNLLMSFGVSRDDSASEQKQRQANSHIMCMHTRVPFSGSWRLMIRAGVILPRRSHG